jgi:hypothetical protein
MKKAATRDKAHRARRSRKQLRDRRRRRIYTRKRNYWRDHSAYLRKGKRRPAFSAILQTPPSDTHFIEAEPAPEKKAPRRNPFAKFIGSVTPRGDRFSKFIGSVLGKKGS